MKTINVTIFIHGTLLPTFTTIPFLYHFFHCPAGLTPATGLGEQFHLHKLAQLLSHHDEFPLESFYLFGWSGKLGFKERKQAAQELMVALQALKRVYNTQELEPVIRIITHSHGGNVALYLKEAGNNDIIIDELILLACPVQIETEQYVVEKMFRKVYSIHSHKDLLQILDPQGIHNFLESLKTLGFEFTLQHLKQIGPLFSARHFSPAAHLTQLNIKYAHREFLHIEFLLPAFITHLPALLTLMRTHKKDINVSGPDDLTHIV